MRPTHTHTTADDMLSTDPGQPEAGPLPAGQTMRAIVQRAYGGADTWSLGEVERPAIGEREVLVRVRAAGLDRGTWHLMAGLPYAVRLGYGLRGPKRAVPGLDLAGVVVSVGSKVTRFAPGDEVMGIGTGSFAEFAAAPEEKLAHKPAALSFEAAAALPVSGLTAIQGLRGGEPDLRPEVLEADGLRRLIEDMRGAVRLAGVLQLHHHPATLLARREMEADPLALGRCGRRNPK